MPRCPWASTPLLASYHDDEWGVPERDPARLFELLTLEGAQSGLSWATILRKREGYRRAFCGFDADAVARFRARDVARLLRDASIVRHKGKIESVVANARAILAMRARGEALPDLVWGVVEGAPVRNAFRAMEEIPAQTPLSRALSKELKARGFRFVGPTTVYAFLQAAGVVNDHLVGCPARGSPLV